jgi:hypothetical protein
VTICGMRIPSGIVSAHASSFTACAFEATRDLVGSRHWTRWALQRTSSFRKLTVVPILRGLAGRGDVKYPASGKAEPHRQFSRRKTFRQ